MLIGVGCDLIEIERVKKACDKEAFLSRIYTERERRRQREIPGSLPALLPLKKQWFMPIHVEVLRDPLGKPYVELHEGAAKTAEDLGITKIEVSISDTKDHAMAFAVGEGEAG